MTLDQGPDQIRPADSYQSTERTGAVKLHVGDTAPDNYEPISIPSLLEKVTTITTTLGHTSA